MVLGYTGADQFTRLELDRLLTTKNEIIIETVDLVKGLF